MSQTLKMKIKGCIVLGEIFERYFLCTKVVKGVLAI
jgi:hypothetical protein